MKLVVSYYTGSTFDGTNIDIPIEYESAEAFIINLEEMVDNYYKEWLKFIDRKCTFPSPIGYLGNTEFYLTDFIDQKTGKKYLPGVQTLDEWWQSNLRSF